MGPTPWARQVINLIAPHLIVDEEEAAAGAMIKEDSINTDEYPISALDPSVFKSRSRSYRKAEDATSGSNYSSNVTGSNNTILE